MNEMVMDDPWAALNAAEERLVKLEKELQNELTQTQGRIDMLESALWETRQYAKDQNAWDNRFRAILREAGWR